MSLFSSPFLCYYKKLLPHTKISFFWVFDLTYSLIIFCFLVLSRFACDNSEGNLGYAKHRLPFTAHCPPSADHRLSPAVRRPPSVIHSPPYAVFILLFSITTGKIIYVKSVKIVLYSTNKKSIIYKWVSFSLYNLYRSAFYDQSC